jgi:CelD/BcsL family acetyltransferase involved in cellulose biosynthesis
VDLDEWQAIADASPYATFFHTPAWLSIFARSDPATRIATRIYRFEDGKSAVFPLLERRRLGGLVVTAESSPASCYGGPISADPLTPSHVLPVVRDILRRSSNLIWRVNPLDPLGNLLDPFRAFTDSTEILDLRTFADEGTLVAHFRHSVRKQINKGCRAGLTTSAAERWEEWEEYYRIYEARIRQWGATATNRYPIEFFRALYAARGPKLRLWVVARDGRIVGGNLNFYQGRHCVEWHAAYDCELFSCGVRDYLVDWIVRDAWARGFRWYDFNPSGGHEGSRRFKQSFGTAPLPSNVIIVRRGIYRLELARHALHFARGLGRHQTGGKGARAPAVSPG